MGPSTLLGTGRRTLLGSFCKLNLSVNGSPLIHKSDFIAYGKTLNTHSDVKVAAMRSPALLRHEVLGPDLHEVDVPHLVIRMKEAIHCRGLSRRSRDGVNHLVSTEGRIEQEGSSLNLFEFSVHVNIQVRSLYHEIACCVYRIDANDSCPGHGRAPLTSRHSDACSWVLRRNGSVTLTTIWTEAVEAAKANKLSADEIARQIKCEISKRYAISGVIKYEDVCNNSNSTCDFQPFIHRNNVCIVEVMDIVID